MSLTKDLTSENPSVPTPGTEDYPFWEASMPVMVTLAQLKAQQAGYRKSLVKTRRNQLAQAAKLHKAGDEVSAGEARRSANNTLLSIRKMDARMGLLSLAPATTKFKIDLRDPELEWFGFGMDHNGNYPAL
jgi:hypothetical protein